VLHGVFHAAEHDTARAGRHAARLDRKVAANATLTA
jgi:hypothetical protein